MHINRSAAGLAFLLCVANGAVSHAQRADAGRVGASARASRGMPASPADTAIITIVRPSHIRKYMAIGAATGILAGVATAAYEVTHCDGPSTHEMPACLGIDLVAYLTLFTGTVVGTVGGTILGGLVDARQR